MLVVFIIISFQQLIIVWIFLYCATSRNYDGDNFNDRSLYETCHLWNTCVQLVIEHVAVNLCDIFGVDERKRIGVDVHQHPLLARGD